VLRSSPLKHWFAWYGCYRITLLPSIERMSSRICSLLHVAVRCVSAERNAIAKLCRENRQKGKRRVLIKRRMSKQNTPRATSPSSRATTWRLLIVFLTLFSPYVRMQYFHIMLYTYNINTLPYANALFLSKISLKHLERKWIVDNIIPF